MKFNKWILISFLIFSCQSHKPTHADYQKPSDPHPLMAGADKCIRNECSDSCIVTYKDFTIVTRPHKQTVGEEIFVIMKKNNRRIKIDRKDEALYFYGVFHDKIIIDAGTGSLRRNFIYDLAKQSVIDSIDLILEDSKIINGKLNYLAMMPQDRVDSLNLPKCEQSDLEGNGYYEEFNYDFGTRRKVSTGKYKCIK